MEEFGLIAVFVKVALEITKKSSALRFIDSPLFIFFSKPRKSTCGIQTVVECIKVICKTNE